MIIAWGYVRVSTEMQKKSHLSLNHQIDQIIRYADYKGFDLGAVKMERDADGNMVESRERIILECESAYKKRLRDRPGGKFLCANVAKGEHIVFCFLDRGFRNPIDCLSQFNLWKDKDIKVHFLDINVDTSTPVGEMLIAIMSALSKWESDRRGERMRASHAERKKKGIANQPWKAGYIVVNKRFVSCIKQRHLMALIMERRQAGESHEKIALWLTKNGITVPHRLKDERLVRFNRGSVRFTRKTVESYETSYKRLRAEEEENGTWPNWDVEAGKKWFEELMKKPIKNLPKFGMALSRGD